MTPAAGIIRYLTELDKICRTGNAAGCRCVPALKALFESLIEGLTISHEPEASVYIITKDAVLLGYIEIKGISAEVNGKANKEPVDRCRRSFNNFIITDYLTFSLFVDGESVITAAIAGEDGGGIVPDKEQFPAFLALINRFAAYSGKTIYQLEQLAKLMAEKTKILAAIMKAALNEKTANDTLYGQYENFKQAMVHNLETEQFAGIYAQTLAYGLFAARLNQNDNQPFTRCLAPRFLPQSNPFLRKFFNYIASRELDRRITWIVDALADMFNRVAVEEIVKQFVKADQDPFIHFYETFLAEYDPLLRETRGVYYTPVPVVKFIVQAVDDILKTEFNLKNGIADHSKIKRAIPGKDGKPEIVELHKVQILDPAAGTGTFLAEVIEKIFSYFTGNKGAWHDYCENHIIPRLYGFELLMAPYAMAHFKLDMKLKETGFSFTPNNHLQVYLTNSLEEPEKIEQYNIPMTQWHTLGTDEASRIKKDIPVMAILGNPPFKGESANSTGGNFLSSYKKEPGGVDKLKEKNLKWLNDDYVKFICYGQNSIEKYGSGVLAYINNNGFLDNPTFRGMRWNLLKTFDKIYILDLHGSAKKREIAPGGNKDENVFDIQTGVSINLFIKNGRKKEDELAQVFHYDVYGKREMKYLFLREHTLSTINWNIFNSEPPLYFFTKKNFGNKPVYEKGFSIKELFISNGVGICTKRDKFTIYPTVDALKEAILDFLSLDDEDARQKFNLGKDSDEWNIKRTRYDLTAGGEKNQHPDFNKIIKINYRPFDIRYTYYTGRKGFHSRPAKNIMRHFIQKENIGLVTSRQGQAAGSMPWNMIFITPVITDLNLYYRGGGLVFPLYKYHFNNSDERTPNLNKDMVNTISNKIGLPFTYEKEAEKNTFAPIDILDYIYAVLYSTLYRTQYKEFLKIDFPRIPYPENAEQFQKLAAIGSLLRNLHLMENVNPVLGRADFPIAGTNEVKAVKYQAEKISINGNQYFENVPPQVWEYYIGGYRPAEKWLRDRKGRVLSFADIEHYQKIITALTTTIELQRQIDEVFEI